MTLPIRRCIVWLLAVLGATQACAAYPDKPIRLVVPWAAGGSTDAVARAIGQQMSSALGQEIVVENRAGGSGMIGTQAAARAPADGYTITIVELPHAIAPSVIAKIPYDLQRDFAPIGLIGTSALMLFTGAAVPAHQTLAQWLGDARAKAGALALAHSGNGAVRPALLRRTSRSAPAMFTPSTMLVRMASRSPNNMNATRMDAKVRMRRNLRRRMFAQTSGSQRNIRKSPVPGGPSPGEACGSRARRRADRGSP